MLFAKASFYRNHAGRYSAKFGNCNDHLYSFLCQLNFISYKIVTGSFESRKINFTDTAATLMDPEFPAANYRFKVNNRNSRTKV